MKGIRFKEEQIISILKKLEGGTPIKEICREYAITQQTIYRWKAKFGGMEVSWKRRS